jgi:two-component system response regulator BaeR
MDNDRARQRILIVEDEEKIAALIGRYLDNAGYSFSIVGDGAEVMPMMAAMPYDMVLLDLSLPNVDGLIVCQRIRQTYDIPVMIITARIEEIDRLIGLESGADDYLCKPFSPREAVARVNAILRRFKRTILETDQSVLLLDAQRSAATYQRIALNLTPVEFRLLRALSSSPGKLCSRDALLDGMYDDHRLVTDRTVDAHIKNLRRKLLAAGAPDKLIVSVYKLGYRLDLPTSAIVLE